MSLQKLAAQTKSIADAREKEGQIWKRRLLQILAAEGVAGLGYLGYNALSSDAPEPPHPGQ